MKTARTIMGQVLAVVAASGCLAPLAPEPTNYTYCLRVADLKAPDCQVTLAQYDLHIHSVDWLWNGTSHLLTGSFVLSAIHDRPVDVRGIYYRASALELSDDEGQHGQGWAFQRGHSSAPPLRLDAHESRSFSMMMQFRSGGPTFEHMHVTVGAFFMGVPAHTWAGDIEYDDSCLRLSGDRLVYDVRTLDSCDYRKGGPGSFRFPSSTISVTPPQEPKDNKHLYLAPPFDREFWEPICGCFG